MNKKEIPIWEKSNLTLEEAAAYFGIGVNTLKNMTASEDCKFVLWLVQSVLLSGSYWMNILPAAIPFKCGQN